MKKCVYTVRHAAVVGSYTHLHALRKSKEHERRPAQTALQRLGTFERYSLLQARPYTGRQHQIRKHVKHISHPAIGDVRYGKSEHNRLFRERFALHRLCLHASKLRLEHPHSGAALEFRAPLPADLAQPFEQMGLANSAQDSIAAALWAPAIVELPILASDDDA